MPTGIEDLIPCPCGCARNADTEMRLRNVRAAGHDPKRVVSVSVLDMPYIQALLAAYADLLAAVEADDYWTPETVEAAAAVHRVIDEHTETSA